MRVSVKCEFEDAATGGIQFPPLQAGPSLNHATGVILNAPAELEHTARGA